MDGEQLDPRAAGEPEGMAKAIGRKCFVIMPYGVRTDLVTGRTCDFERVYERLTEPVVTSLGMECIRSDKVSQSGMIHKEMIEHIVNADIAIVDITMGNPNVMYELGIRHTARRSGTAIIRDAGSAIPFNIAGMRAIDYNVPADDSPDSAVILENSKQLLTATLKNCLDHRSNDSLVHSVVPGLNVALPAKVIAKRTKHIYPLASGKRFEIITGDIANIDNVDAWVNPENTRMELARMHDSSVSAEIRYRGAYRNKLGHVSHDAVQQELLKILGRRTWAGVEPGTVILTSPGALKRSNGVKIIAHVAAHHGEPGKGYQLIKSYAACVTNSLDAIDAYNGRLAAKFRPRSLVHSVLFPLFGNRGRGESSQDVTAAIVQAAHEYLLTWNSTRLESISFLAYTDRDLEQCQVALLRLGLECSKISRNADRA